MASIDSDIDDLRTDFKKNDADLAITRNVNSKLRERVVSLESDNFRVTSVFQTLVPGNKWIL